MQKWLQMRYAFIVLLAFSPFIFGRQSLTPCAGSFASSHNKSAGFAVEHKKLSFAEPTPAERKLHALINAYRASHKLPAIPLSKSLSYVARTHVHDLNAHPPESPCNAHSWSEHGVWSSCCYTPDHKQAKCMWDKPAELTNYKDSGFEIGYWTSAEANAEEALEGWKTSAAHNAVIINQTIWKNEEWRSLGVGLAGQYAVVWFGKKKDPDGYWEEKAE